MPIIADIVMLAWIPVVLLLFAVLPPRRAVIVAFLAAWLFLPIVGYRLPFLPDYTKMSGTCAGVLLGAMAFDTKRLLNFRPQWIDLPMVVYCLSPFLSSITNGLGAWDGISAVMIMAVTWGLPYFVGRIYFTNVGALRELAIGIFVGGVIYIPFCMFEMRMSPQLHYMFYGSFPRQSQMRFGGWRPAVFMESGLQLGLWMTAATLIGIWLWRNKIVKQLGGISVDWLVVPLMITTVLCRASGALLLLVAGLIAMWIVRSFNTRTAVCCLLMIAPLYVGIRTTGLWSGQQFVDLVSLVDADRAQSLQFRIDNENILVARALERPFFGWGGWSRSRVFDEWGKDLTVTDGHWIIELGARGLLGMFSCFVVLLAPMALLVSRFSARQLASVEMAPVLALGMVTILYAIDCLPNAMQNPVYMLAGGAVASVAVAGRKVLASAVERRTASRRSGPTSGSAPPRQLYPVCP